MSIATRAIAGAKARLKNALDSLACCHGNEHSKAKKQRAVDVARYTLKTLEAAQWISVEDQLPNKAMPCLIYTMRGRYGGIEQSYYKEGFSVGSEYEIVTHWMPLPEPPVTKKFHVQRASLPLERQRPSNWADANAKEAGS